MNSSEGAGKQPEWEPVERLLLGAAEWEPDAPAPEGLAARALAAELERQAETEQRRLYRARAGFFGGLFLGASAVSASVALAFIRLGPSPAPGVMRAQGEPGKSTVGFAGNARRGPLVPETGKKTVRSGPIMATAVVEAGERRPRQGIRERRRRRPVSASGESPRGTGAVRVARVEVPAAVWRQEKVRHEVAGVLASGWLLHEDPESGEWRLSPSVLDLPAVAQTSSVTCEGPDTLEMFEISALEVAPPSGPETAPSRADSGAGLEAVSPVSSSGTELPSLPDPCAPLP